MSKSDRLFIGLVGVAAGYFLARKLGKETDVLIKDFFVKKKDSVLKDAKDILQSSDATFEDLKSKVDSISLEIDEKINALKQMMEEEKNKS